MADNNTHLMLPKIPRTTLNSIIHKPQNKFVCVKNEHFFQYIDNMRFSPT